MVGRQGHGAHMGHHGGHEDLAQVDGHPLPDIGQAQQQGGPDHRPVWAVSLLRAEGYGPAAVPEHRAQHQHPRQGQG